MKKDIKPSPNLEPSNREELEFVMIGQPSEESVRKFLRVMYPGYVFKAFGTKPLASDICVTVNATRSK